MMRPLFFFLLLAVSFTSVSTSSISSPFVGDPIEVFVIPHSHCDAGWLQTLDSYFELNVSLILTQVTTALVNDPSLKFCWSEIVFFQMWWETISPEWQQEVHELVSSGRWEFVGGGWVQNDEAVTYYGSVIDQLTQGHQFLYEVFGVQPRVGWQIDPFGPSTMTPLLNRLAGFPYHVMNRIDDRLRHVYNASNSIFTVPGSGSFIANETFEFIWQPSKNYGTSNQIFTHVLENHYSPPQLCWPNATNPVQSICTGYDFEGGADSNPPINSSNIADRANILASVLQTRSSYYRHNKLLVLFGNDFRYQNASLEFDNIGMLIDYINNNASFGMTLKYATPIEYFQAVENSTQPSTFPIVLDNDYFPYTMCSGYDWQNFTSCANYWTGYYTSYPVLKGYSRSRDALLRIGEQLYVISKSACAESPFYTSLDWSTLLDYITILREASAVVNHHDAITGTARSYVRQDYFDRLDAGTNATNAAIAATLGLLMAKSAIPPLSADPSVISPAPGQTFPVVIYNSLGWDRSETVRIPIQFRDVIVSDINGNYLKSQVMEDFSCVVSQSAADNSCDYILYFQVTIPALGFSTYFIEYSTQMTQKKHGWQKLTGEMATINLENEFYSAVFEYNNNDGIYYIGQIENKIDRVQFDVQHQVLNYTGMVDDPYKFRPAGPPTPYRPGNTQVYYAPGPLVQELAVVYDVNLTVIYRLYTEIFNATNTSTWANFLEVDHWISLSNDSEVVSRFSVSNISSGGIFYTDNGLEMQRRVYQERYNDSAPWSMISGNFYPVINTAYLTDGDLQFTILTNQSMGGSSQTPNSLEVMLHRRTTNVHFSLQEYQNDTSTAHITLRLLLGKQESSERNRIPISYSHQYPLFPVYGFPFASDSFGNWSQSVNPSFAPLQENLPPNLHLLSLKSFGAESPFSILRFVHLYEEGQDAAYSQNTTLSLSSLFLSSVCNVTGVYETSLTANEATSKSTQAEYYSFNPIQIRTFVANVN